MPDYSHRMDLYPHKPAPRYYVHTVYSSVNNVKNPHRVIDRETGLELDEYTSKKAASMHADELNRAEKA